MVIDDRLQLDALEVQGSVLVASRLQPAGELILKA